MGHEGDSRELRPSDPSARPADRPISRRLFIGVAAGSAAGLVLARGKGLPGAWASTPLSLPAGDGSSFNQLHLGALRSEITGATPNLVFQAVRTEDMLYLG